MSETEIVRKILRYLNYRVKDAESGDYRLHNYVKMIRDDVEILVTSEGIDIEEVMKGCTQ